MIHTLKTNFSFLTKICWIWPYQESTRR